VARGDETGSQQITVFDNGPGIGTTEMPKLSGRFLQRSRMGRGWAAVVQKIISAAWRQGKRGIARKAAAFIVTLPLREGFGSSRIKEGQHLILKHEAAMTLCK